MVQKPVRKVDDVPGLGQFVPDVHDGPMVSFTFDDGWDCQRQYAVPILDAAGVKGSFAIISDWLGTVNTSVTPNEQIMTGAQAKALYDSGHEICNHTKTHLAFSSTSEPRAILADIDGCDAALRALDIIPSTSFVLPFGDVQRTNVGMACIAERFDSFRTVVTQSIFNQGARSVGMPFEIRSNSHHTNDTLDDTKIAVDIAAAHNAWLVFTFHHISPSVHPSGTTIHWSDTNLAALIAYVQSLGIRVVTLEEGYRIRAKAAENLMVAGDLEWDSVTKGPGQSNYLGIWNKTVPAAVTDVYDTSETYTPYVGATPLNSRHLTRTGTGAYSLTQEFPCEPNTDYTMSLANKRSGATSEMAFGINEHAITRVTGAAAWGQSSITFNSGPNVRLLAKVQWDGNSGDEMWFTGIRVTKSYTARSQAKNQALNGSRVKLIPDMSREISATGEIWHDVNTHTLRTHGTSGQRETIPSYLKLASKTVNIAETTIAHGLGRTPTFMQIIPTAAGQIWQSKAADGTNIYLKADADGRTCDVCVS